ncbi:MAG: hypothetical protein PF694_00320 [Bacteroidetes bacterium]|nr:hypothetical protein [Bacteroidota bacterium]
MKTPILSIQKISQLALGMLLIAGLTMASCNKKDDENPDPGGGDDPSTENPSPQLGAGTLVAIKTQNTTSTPIGDITTTIGLGVAAFSSNGYSSLTDAGSVQLNGNALTKQSNNSYVFMPSITNPTGIELGNTIEWEVAGNGDTPAFSHTVQAPFPTVGAITSSTDVSKSGYTLTVASVTNADSVYFQVGNVLKALAGNTRSYEFTAAELSGLSTGQSIIQVAPYKISQAAYGGKNFYFVNETTVSASANITE